MFAAVECSPAHRRRWTHVLCGFRCRIVHDRPTRCSRGIVAPIITRSRWPVFVRLLFTCVHSFLCQSFCSLSRQLHGANIRRPLLHGRCPLLVLIVLRHCGELSLGSVYIQCATLIIDVDSRWPCFLIKRTRSREPSQRMIGRK